MCFLFQGFSIGQLSHALLLGNVSSGDFPDPSAALLKTVPFVHSATAHAQFPPSAFGDRAPLPPGVDVSRPEEHCPTLKECLLYQACVFSFGNEFCLRDPMPGKRKNIDLNVTCVRVRQRCWNAAVPAARATAGATAAAATAAAALALTTTATESLSTSTTITAAVATTNATEKSSYRVHHEN